MAQFEKVSTKVDGNAAKKVDEGPNYPLPHGLEREVKLLRRHAIGISSCDPVVVAETLLSKSQWLT